MPNRRDVLREVMAQPGVNRSTLSRFSGVRQPSISQYLSGRAELSNDRLARGNRG